MKAMHTMLGTAVLGTLLTGAAFAQTANSTTSTNTNAPTATNKQADRQARHEKMAEKLGLTDDQKTQIKSIHQDAKAQAQAIKNDSTLTPEQKKAKMKELREQTKTKTEALLTPEQKEKMQQARANHKGKRHMHKQGKTQS